MSIFICFLLQVSSRASTKYQLLFVCLVRKSELSKQRQETVKQVVRRGWTSAPQTGRTAPRARILQNTGESWQILRPVFYLEYKKWPCLNADLWTFRDALQEKHLQRKVNIKNHTKLQKPYLMSQMDNSGGKNNMDGDWSKHVASCRNMTPCQCLCGVQHAFAWAGSEECKSLFLTHLPGDCLNFWRTTSSLLCVRLTIETQAPCSERPSIPDLGHNKSPTGSLFLIAATRSASRPSYKHPLLVVLVLISWPHLHDEWWRQPDVGGDTGSSATRIAQILLRRNGSSLNLGQWRVVPLLCSEMNTAEWCFEWEDLFLCVPN